MRRHWRALVRSLRKLRVADWTALVGLATKLVELVRTILATD
ncbi:MAG: hypothetical protein AB7O21_20115 [Gammaproteobacteria bacterium]